MVLPIVLNRSRYLAAALLCAHIATGTVLFSLHLALAWKCVLALLVVASLGHAMQLHVWLTARRSLTTFHLHDREYASVRLRDGTWCDARILGTTFISPFLTVINMRLSGEVRPRHVLVLPDSLPGEDYRRVRVALRWAQPAESRLT